MRALSELNGPKIGNRAGAPIQSERKIFSTQNAFHPPTKGVKLSGTVHLHGIGRRGIVAIWQLLRQSRKINDITPHLTQLTARMIPVRSLF
jgi:hypothetical protein